MSIVETSGPRPPRTERRRRVLVVRLDGAGDVLLAGPAVRAIALQAEVTMLVGPAGTEAARLLPGVRRVLTWPAPWITIPAPPVDTASFTTAVSDIRVARIDEAVVLTSFHQSPLPTALLLRLAGIERITAASVDHPGSLLDVRLRPGEDLPEDIPESERALWIAEAAGFPLPLSDDRRLAVRRRGAVSVVPGRGAVVLHPGGAAPARRWPAGHFRQTVALLAAQGRHVIVTGSAAERDLTSTVARAGALDLGGRTTFAGLADVLEQAAVVVAGNTGAAHLAAAVGTPVVSLFAPVVPAVRWRPHGVPIRVLGEQHAPCRDSRARTCPVAGHPCLSGITPQMVVSAIDELVGAPQAVVA